MPAAKPLKAARKQPQRLWRQLWVKPLPSIMKKVQQRLKALMNMRNQKKGILQLSLNALLGRFTGRSHIGAGATSTQANLRQVDTSAKNARERLIGAFEVLVILVFLNVFSRKLECALKILYVLISFSAEHFLVSDIRITYCNKELQEFFFGFKLYITVIELSLQPTLKFFYTFTLL